MTTNQAQMPRDVPPAEPPRVTPPVPAAGDKAPAPRRPLHMRAVGFARSRLQRLLHRVDLALLPLWASGPFCAKVYYFLFNPSFSREQHATLAGRLHYVRHEASSAVASVIVRRNIHRLEKGLSMAAPREVFALDYIDETLTAFANLLDSPHAHDQSLARYAHDVLRAYFSATKWQPAARQPRQFEGLSAWLQAAGDRQGSAPPAAPTAQAALPPTDISYAQFLTLTQRRASVRNFLPLPVPRQDIERAVAAAAQAPSACNRQPLRYIAVADDPVKRQLSELPMGTAGYAQNIPVMLAVVGDLSAYPFERDRHVIYIDASLANMQFMLALETMGLASCAINWPDMEQRERQAAALLQLAPHERIVMLMAVGYPDPQGLVPHSEKKQLGEMLRWM